MEFSFSVRGQNSQVFQITADERGIEKMEVASHEKIILRTK